MDFLVTCERGAEGPLRRELVGLRIRAPKGELAGVSFSGTFTDAMKVCLHARTAMRVLMTVGAFEVGDADSLYAGVRALDWTSHLTPQTTLAVRAHVRDNPALAHTGFAALKVKDAIVDAIRDRLGNRPDVNVDDPDVPVVLSVHGQQAKLQLDLAGVPLHRRGYRVAMTDAPLKETLAAAVLALGGISPDLPFVDPMAGSGTLAIEHALRARAIPPGLGRSFAFLRWPDAVARAAWTQLLEEARARVVARAPASILARDRDPLALEAARKNAAAAGVASDIQFEAGDVATLAMTQPHGTLCANPPYGERLEGRPGDLQRIYQTLALVAHTLWGWRIVLLAGNPRLGEAMAVRPDVSHRLWNGGLEVRLLAYQLGHTAGPSRAD